MKMNNISKSVNKYSGFLYLIGIVLAFIGLGIYFNWFDKPEFVDKQVIQIGNYDHYYFKYKKVIRGMDSIYYTHDSILRPKMDSTISHNRIGDFEYYLNLTK